MVAAALLGLLTIASTAPPSDPPPVVEPAAETIETAAVGLSLLEQEHPAPQDSSQQLDDCWLFDQADIDDAFAAIGQPEPYLPLTGVLQAGTLSANGQRQATYQIACEAVAPDGVVAPTSTVTVAVATKSSTTTIRDLIADTDPHTITDEPDEPVLGAALLGYCYDYDAASFCFQSFDYGTFAVIVKMQTPPADYDTASLSTAAQAIVPTVVERLAAAAPTPPAG